MCGHVARRLAAPRGQVCNERLAIETPAVPATPVPDGHAPRAAFRREATITARAGHRTRPVVVTPDAPTRRGVGPSPRRPRAGSPTPLSASTPDGPTPARCDAWTPDAGPPRLTTPRSPSTSASSSRLAARPPPPPWPSPPSGFGQSSPASRPPPGKRPPACWAASGARPPTGADSTP